MTQKAFVVFVNLVAYKCFLVIHLLLYCVAKLVYNLFKNRLIENILLAIHHAQHIIACEQFATLQNDAVTMGVQSIYPQLLVEYLACKDKHLHILMLRLQLLANLHTDGCASTKTEVEKHKIGLVGCEHFPERVLRIGCSYNLCLGHLAMQESFCAFEFEQHVLHYDNFKLFHISFFI